MSVRPEVVLLLGAGGVGLLALLFPLLLRRNDPPAPLLWPRLAVAAAAIVLLFGLTRLSAYPFSPGGTLGNGLVLGGLTALVTAALALLGPVAAGFVTAGLLLLLTSGVRVFRRSGVQGEEGRPLNVQDERFALVPPERLNALPALLAPTLALLLLAAAYRLYTGYGIALAALGALVLLPWLAEREPVALGRAFFGLLVAGILFRVYYHAYDLGNSDIPLTAHYALVGLLAGALMPFAWGALQAAGGRWPATGDRRPVTGGAGPNGFWLLPLVACLLAAALPLRLAVFWGEKVGGGLLLGLAVGQGYRMMAALLEVDAPGPVGAIVAAVPEAAPLATGWVAVQILDWGANFGLQLLRVQRVGIVAALVTLCFLAILFFTARRPDVRN
jgi:hypothetical protein